MANILGLDIGDKRIGIAIADVSAPFPAPLITLEASQHLAQEFALLLKKYAVTKVVIGLPRNQQGERTKQTDRVKHIAKLLKIPNSIEVYWQDESLTSVKAEAELKKRKKPYAKAAIDSLAATYILEDFIAHPTEQVSQQESNNIPNKKPKKSKSKVSRRKKIILGLITLFAIALITIITTGVWYLHALSSKTTDDVYSVISVKSGDGVSKIALDLEQNGIIRSATAFKIYIKLNNISHLQAGEYRLSSKLSASEIAKILSSGKVTTVNVLIAPGLTIAQIADVLEKDGFDKAEIKTAFARVRDHQLLANLPADATLEGYLFPDTYQVGPSTTAETLLRLMLDNFEKKLTPEITQGIKQQGLTLHQAVTLASIVQKEVADAATQKTVAQVFLKRYNEGKMLGSDVTALYGALNDDVKLPKNAAEAAAIAIAHPSPYNTRKVVGLPPTAISNFNLSALSAVAMPSQTDYLFFVAGDDGTTHFARTLEEHEANVAKYCIKGCG